MAIIDKKTVLALGFFDSLHLGHRYLLQQAEELANNYNLTLKIFTFNDNFLKNLNRQEKEVYTLNERIELLKNLGYNDIEIIDPSKEFLSKNKKEFIEYIKSFHPVAIVAGSDYHFGKNGEGNINFMKEYFADEDIEIKEINLQKKFNSKISSTKIRKYLEKGKIKKANFLLGEKYSVVGEVIKGRGEGRKFGIPTANINPNSNKMLPKSGVYVTHTLVEGNIYKSITNVGKHPTFFDENFNIETLILDFNKDIYSNEIKVYFDKRIRSIKKFKSPKILSLQINKDIKKVRKMI